MTVTVGDSGEQLDLVGTTVTANGVEIGSRVDATGQDAATDDVFQSGVSGDSDPRFVIDADGTFRWGNGSATEDVVLSRPETGVIAIEAGDTFRLKGVSNATMDLSVPTFKQGRISSGGALAGVLVKSTSTGYPVLTIQSSAGQTDNLQEWQDSAGTVLGSRDSGGRSLVPLSSSSDCGIAFQGDPDTGIHSSSADFGWLAAGGVDVLGWRWHGSARKIGFFGATPVVQQTAPADATGTDATQINAIRDALVNLGLMA